jgi:SagB-type dehydrogenase domain
VGWLLEQADSRDGSGWLVHWRPGVVVQVTDDGLVLAHPWGVIGLGQPSARLAEMIHRLGSEWVALGSLFAIDPAQEAIDPVGAAAALGEQLWLLDRLEFLCQVRYEKSARPVVTAEALSVAARLGTPRQVPTRPRLSRFAFLRRHADGLAIESAIGLHRIVLHDREAVATALALAGISVSPSAQAASGNDQVVLVQLLDSAGMLEGEREGKSLSIGADLVEMAEFHDLLFHRLSRLGHHDGPFGAEFPFLEKIPPLPAIAPPVGGEVVALPSSADWTARPAASLSQVLEERRSERDHGEPPISIYELAEFLFRSSRTRGRYGPTPDAGMPYEALDRPYPSGGGIHDLELYLVITRVAGLEAGAYRYDSHGHALERILAPAEALAALGLAAMRASGTTNPPQVLVKIASRFGRMSWKYRSISYATTLKNVGVLMQTMYLVAEDMKLAACALGSGDDVAASTAFKLGQRSELIVGEFMLGSRVGRESSHARHRPGYRTR